MQVQTKTLENNKKLENLRKFGKFPSLEFDAYNLSFFNSSNRNNGNMTNTLFASNQIETIQQRAHLTLFFWRTFEFGKLMEYMEI